MKSKKFEPVPFVKYDEEGALAMPVLVELLRAILDKGKPFRFEATGSSMSPFVRDGDVITVSPLSDISPRLGDVVAFIRPENEKLVVHRVVGERDGFYLIKGDSTTNYTDVIPGANILGRVSRVERNGKRVYLGLGPERCLIAFLTRKERLWLLLPVWRLVRPVVRLLGVWPESERAAAEKECPGPAE